MGRNRPRPHRGNPGSAGGGRARGGDVMPRLARAQEQARRQIVDLASGAWLPERFGRRLLGILQRAVPADGQWLYGVDPTTLLFNRLLAAGADEQGARLRWLRELYLIPIPMGYIHFPALMRAGLAVVALRDRQDACWGYPPAILAGLPAAEHYRLYHEFATPAGGALFVSLAAPGRWIAALTLFRQDAGRPFQPG